MVEPRERRKSEGGVDRGDVVNSEIEALLNRPGAKVQKADFDAGVRRFLGALTGGPNGQQKMKDAMAMLHTYTSQKSRTAVKNWPAYLLTLLKRFEPGALERRLTAGEAAAAGLPSASSEATGEAAIAANADKLEDAMPGAEAEEGKGGDDPEPS
ncbi:unnamed protein product [Effrenium voratum]|uniref:Uncharacterized protein n=1 Tax=Effrenium voratum TaxID=2562239 RepID=A0AA36MHF6_9DINO|nr:unnamed protein product [Effrenium voratum]